MKKRIKKRRLTNIYHNDDDVDDGYNLLSSPSVSLSLSLSLSLSPSSLFVSAVPLSAVSLSLSPSLFVSAVRMC